MAYPVLLMTENNNNWVYQNYVCLLVKLIDWVVSLHNIFGHFLISLQIFTNVMETPDRVLVTKSVV